jgi:hypothetical protein
VAVINTANDKVVTRVQVGTGGEKLFGSIGGGTAMGLATDPFWWFER